MSTSAMHLFPYRPRMKPPGAKLDMRRAFAVLNRLHPAWPKRKPAAPRGIVGKLAERYGVSAVTIRRLRDGVGRRNRWLRREWRRERRAALAGRLYPQRTAGGTYTACYGPENPWVAWLREHAPNLALKTPMELRKELGVPAVPAGPGHVVVGRDGKAHKRRDYFR